MRTKDQGLRRVARPRNWRLTQWWLGDVTILEPSFVLPLNHGNAQPCLCWNQALYSRIATHRVRLLRLSPRPSRWARALPRPAGTATAVLAIIRGREAASPIRQPSSGRVGLLVLQVSLWRQGQVLARGATQHSRRHAQGLDPCGTLFLFLFTAPFRHRNGLHLSGTVGKDPMSGRGSQL
ncbi:hypothetical protein BDW74DRAFT_115227 [Aspergillus multicolor]|uniref:uncharacterized protein n=1 Tax=Aspergillus multicolor TaxID=41759 RepID=UPI003CCDE674